MTALFESFLTETSQATLEQLGVEKFPESAVYSTTYDDENYLAVNLTTSTDMKRYLPKVWDYIRSDIAPDVEDDNFSFIAFINENNVGASLYITNELKVISKAESKPDGSESNSAALKMIAILKTEERIEAVQEEIMSSDIEPEEKPKEESVKEFSLNDLTEDDNKFLSMLDEGSVIFGWQPGVASREMMKLGLVDYNNIGGYKITDAGRKHVSKSITESVVSVHVPLKDVKSLYQADNLEKKVLYSILHDYPGLTASDVDVFIHGDKSQLNVNITNEEGDNIDSDHVEEVLRSLVSESVERRTRATMMFKELSKEDGTDVVNTFKELGYDAKVSGKNITVNIKGNVDAVRTIVSTVLQTLFSFSPNTLEDVTYEVDKETTMPEFKELKEKREVYEFSACENCIQAIANDDYTGMSDKEETRCKKGIGELEKEYDLMVDGKELGFSTQHCEICGALPGDRYLVNGMKKDLTHEDDAELIHKSTRGYDHANITKTVI